MSLDVDLEDEDEAPSKAFYSMHEIPLVTEVLKAAIELEKMRVAYGPAPEDYSRLRAIKDELLKSLAIHKAEKKARRDRIRRELRQYEGGDVTPYEDDEAGM